MPPLGKSGQVSWYKPVNLAPGKQRQMDQEFKVMGYIVCVRPTQVT